MVGVCIGEDPSREGLNRDVILTLSRDSELREGVLISDHPVVGDGVEVAVVATALRDLPQLDRLVCGGGGREGGEGGEKGR